MVPEEVVVVGEGRARFSRAAAVYKLKAAAVSLAVFLLFATLMVWVTYYFWFPDYLFWTDGGMQGLRLVLAVDFVLGPVLALVFFHPEKSRGKLLFDIAVIGCIQLSAMVWGAYQVYSQRPVAVVYGAQRFISVAPAIMALQYKAPSDLARYSPHSPPYVYRREPRSQAERQRQLAMLWQNGFHFESQAWLFEPFLENTANVFERQASIREYLQKNMAEAWESWVAGREQREPTVYRLAFYEGRYSNALLIFSAQGDYLDYLPMGDAPLPNLKVEPVNQ